MEDREGLGGPEDQEGLGAPEGRVGGRGGQEVLGGVGPGRAGPDLDVHLEGHVSIVGSMVVPDCLLSVFLIGTGNCRV